MYIMKLYYFSDSKFEIMKKQFESSIKDSFEKKHIVVPDDVSQDTTGGGLKMWKFRIDVIIDAIKEGNANDIIIISDIDILFYKKAEPLITQMFSENHETEIIFQKEASNGGINVGFIAMKCNNNVLNFWINVHNNLIEHEIWEQQIVNDLIYKLRYPIKWQLFPHSIWTWSQGFLNKDIILHHANCAKYIRDKFNQMNKVSQFILGHDIIPQEDIPN